MQFASMLVGAIGFDPEIRGILVLLVGVVVLMGSVFLILSTNSGARAAFLLLMSGTFSWMVMMGLLWTIYGIGFIGRAPAWMATDINFSRDTPVSQVPELEQIPPAEDLPNAVELLDQHPLLHALVLGAEGPEYQPATLTKLKTVIEPMVIVSKSNLRPKAQGALENAGEILDVNPDLAPLLTNRGDALQLRVHAEAAELRQKIEDPIGDWCLLTESDPRRGEAVASADGALIAEEAFGNPTETSDYIVEDVFVFGGKEPCEPIAEKSVASRSWHRVFTTIQVKNPKLLGAVTLVKAKDVVVEPGQAPPTATAEPGASMVTVAMLRNLGNRRAIPFAVTIVSLLGFIVFTTMLHYRDKRAMELRAAFTGAKKA